MLSSTKKRGAPIRLSVIVMLLLLAGLLGAGIWWYTGSSNKQSHDKAIGTLSLADTTAASRNGTLEMTLSVAAEVPINGVHVVVAYDQSQLGYTSASEESSSFPVALATEHTEGKIVVDRGILGSTTKGDSRITTLHFTKRTAAPKTPTITAAYASTSGQLQPLRFGGNVLPTN